MTKTIFSYSLLLCTLLFLTNCTYFKTMRKIRLQTKQCQAACLVNWQNCAKYSQNNGKNCMRKCRFDTILYYNRYLREQTVQGVKVIRQLNSFRDPLKCTKVTGYCEADYQMCLNVCQGVYPITQIKPAFCC